MRALTAFRRDVSVAMAAYDVLLLPTTATWAWPAADPGPTRIAGQPVGSAGANPYVSWVNALGYPGLNVPVAPLANGLPIGVQLVARAGGDRILLDVAELIGTPMPPAG
jgi:Asp-tRNA(Asn)/Glu-tRNA(Gln) amidotransferase A subunit family amidase